MTTVLNLSPSAQEEPRVVPTIVRNGGPIPGNEQILDSFGPILTQVARKCADTSVRDGELNKARLSNGPLVERRKGRSRVRLAVTDRIEIGDDVLAQDNLR